MFNFLKKKLKGAVSKFSNKVEEEAEKVEDTEITEEEKEEDQREQKQDTVPEKTEKVDKEEKQGKKRVGKEKKAKGTEKKRAEKVEPKKEIIKESEKVDVKEDKKKQTKAKDTDKKTEPVSKEIKKEELEELEEKKKEIKEELPKEREEPKTVKEKKPGFIGRLFGKKIEGLDEEKPKEVKKPDVEPESTEQPKKGLFKKISTKITTKILHEKQFDELFWDLELVMLENNVAMEVIEKIKIDLKKDLVEKPIPRTKIQERVLESLKKSIMDLFEVEGFDLLEKAKGKKPYVICFVGINGSGKTTTIAKVVKLMQDNGLSCVLAAADTFRAAAIDQLSEHAEKLGVKIIKHDYGSDAAAVAFDAVKHAEAKGKDVVLIDTAGRLHSNVGLMDELKKVIRVSKPDLKIFIGESITGNDCVEQAKKFDEAVGVDGIILSKADVDEKGGAAISVSYVTGKPILYLGTGQEYNDLEKFDSSKLMESLGL